MYVKIYKIYFLDTEAEFMNVKFRWGFLGIILRVLRLKVSLYNVSRSDCEKQDFCPSYYVQEFGLCTPRLIFLPNAALLVLASFNQLGWSTYCTVLSAE